MSHDSLARQFGTGNVENDGGGGGAQRATPPPKNKTLINQLP